MFACSVESKGSLQKYLIFNYYKHHLPNLKNLVMLHFRFSFFILVDFSWKEKEIPGWYLSQCLFIFFLSIVIPHLQHFSCGGLVMITNINKHLKLYINGLQ